MSILHQRVLIRQGPRSGTKGIVSRQCPDGTIQVDFPLGVGGGCSSLFYLPDDVEVLGREVTLQETDPFGTAYGPYEYREF